MLGAIFLPIFIIITIVLIVKANKELKSLPLNMEVNTEKARYNDIKRLTRQYQICLVLLDVAFIELTFIYWFAHITAGFSTISKPVIYLYGYNEDVSVNLECNQDSKITVSYPEYTNGWNVKAKEDGTLFDVKGREYGYLYYESACYVNKNFDKGFCVKGEDTVEFLEDILSQYGLTDKEQEDFITYWLPEMQKNRYNVIHFAQTEYKDNIGLDVNPSPDCIIRVIMYFYGSDDFVEIERQEIHVVKRPDNAKIVVEWGGSEVR